MIFDFVVVNNLEDENGKVTQDIVMEGRVVAKDRENALLQIGGDLITSGQDITDEIQVLLRPF
jgi:hypothetical protein